ncbi:hypothetical protein XENOCAPTIV_013005 [Xenoophorus captivus]|uniref:Uncharacterized protein n=1 Tax=Xenoophorus captivus TaxID=1517983 RepID=A0ABV0R056_9TELE
MRENDSISIFFSIKKCTVDLCSEQRNSLVYSLFQGFTVDVCPTITKKSLQAAIRADSLTELQRERSKKCQIMLPVVQSDYNQGHNGQLPRVEVSQTSFFGDHLSTLLCFSVFCRFCVGDKFFLKNNMILCQTDYEEGLMKEGYAPQVR